MQNTEFNTREYFDKIYSRPVILEAKQLTQNSVMAKPNVRF